MNCLSFNHRVATCRLPRRCLRCHGFRHLARDCRRPRAPPLVCEAAGSRTTTLPRRDGRRSGGGAAGPTSLTAGGFVGLHVGGCTSGHMQSAVPNGNSSRSRNVGLLKHSPGVVAAEAICFELLRCREEQAIRLQDPIIRCSWKPACLRQVTPVPHSNLTRA